MKNLLLNCFLSLCLLPLVISSTTEINDENYISEKVFGASDSKKTDDFISELPDNLLIHLMRQFPTVPFKLWAVNSFFKEFVERNSPNQQVLAENLGLNGFKTLPLHGDLRVFENVKFPKDSTGKVTSLVFVFMMSSRVLSRSSILDAVLGIVYEEAALLAQNAPAEFENFLKLSRFEIVADPISVFKHFAKKENIYGLIEFMAACPGLFWNSSCIEKFHNEGLLSQVIELVARHVTEKPQIVNLLFSRSKIQRMKLLMLICSELPIESVKEFLQTDCKLEAEVYVHFILSSSDYPIYSSIRNHEQYESRLSEIILCANQLFQSSEEAAPLLNCFKEIHMLSYNLDEWNNPFPEAPIFLNFAFSALFRRGQFDEALKHLPRQVSIPTFKHIAVNEEFSKRLVKENPKWIKDRIYFERLPEEYQSLHFVMADENVDTVDGLTEGSDRLATIRQIYMHCSLESIEKMIERLPHKKIGDYFMCLCEQEMDLPRFIQILALFARSPNAKSEYIYFHACLNVNSFFYLLGQGRVDLLSFILTNPFGIKSVFSEATLAKILQSKEFKPKLFEHKEIFKQFFHPSLSRSPVEIYYGSQFSSKTRIEFVKGLISRVSMVYDCVSCFVQLFALSQALYTADPTIDKYSGTDYLHFVFVNPDFTEDLLENNLMKAIYESLSPRDIAIFNSAFLELEPRVHFEQLRWRPLGDLDDDFEGE